jgi:hypothetical protein
MDTHCRICYSTDDLRTYPKINLVLCKSCAKAIGNSAIEEHEKITGSFSYMAWAFTLLMIAIITVTSIVDLVGK